MFLTGLIEHPDLEIFIEKVITLSAATFMTNFKKNNPIFYYSIPFFKIIAKSLEFMEYYSFFPINIYHSLLFYIATTTFCGRFSNILCKLIFYVLGEKNPSVINYNDIPQAFYKYMSPRASIKNILHFF